MVEHYFSFLLHVNFPGVYNWTCVLFVEDLEPNPPKLLKIEVRLTSTKQSPTGVEVDKILTPEKSMWTKGFWILLRQDFGANFLDFCEFPSPIVHFEMIHWR